MHVIEMILEHEIDDYCYLRVETVDNQKIEAHEVECTEDGLLINSTTTVTRTGEPVALFRGLVEYDNIESIYKYIKEMYIYRKENSYTFSD